MANIGNFTKTGTGYKGEIVTMSVQQKNVRIVAEIGAAWSKQSQEGRDYLSVKLDDPSFVAPIYANLFAEDDGENFSLIWTRSRKVNGE